MADVAEIVKKKISSKSVKKKHNSVPSFYKVAKVYIITPPHRTYMVVPLNRGLRAQGLMDINRRYMLGAHLFLKALFSTSFYTQT